MHHSYHDSYMRSIGINLRIPGSLSGLCFGESGRLESFSIILAPRTCHSATGTNPVAALVHCLHSSTLRGFLCGDSTLTLNAI